MKKILFLLVSFSLLFFSCSQATSSGYLESSEEEGAVVGIMTSDGMRYVYNSNWNDQTLSDLSDAYATVASASVKSVRSTDSEIDIDELETLVEDLNSDSVDTQYYVMTEETDVTESPECVLYVVDENVDPDTGEYYILKQWTLDRSTLAEVKWRYEYDAMGLGGTLYVDHVPAVPEEVIDNRSDYEKYAIYEIYTDDDGKQSIYLSEHSADSSIYTEYWQEVYPSMKDFFAFRVSRYQLDAEGLGSHYSVLYGGLYKIVDGIATYYTEYVE